MRHIFNRGAYRPSGISGKSIREALLTLSPEIYGSMGDAHKVELDGLVYVIERLPKGIEECRFIRLISDEGYANSNFEPIIPPKRVRNCYRIDKEQMFIEVTRGRSEIYDILTHLTFLYHEADKIRKNAFNDKGIAKREWTKLEEIVQGKVKINDQNKDFAFTYLSTILGRTFEEIRKSYQRFEADAESNNGVFQLVYWLGKLSADEIYQDLDREISFSTTLRERVGRHIYGEKWAYHIKSTLLKANLWDRPLHIISANPHSIMNCLYAHAALKDIFKVQNNMIDVATELSKASNANLRSSVKKFAEANGMINLPDNSGTNLHVQIFDTAQIPLDTISAEIKINQSFVQKNKPVLIVMDYAFGEQAYETMDELLKPLKINEEKELLMNVVSISIMGKAGILKGEKGDLMIPHSHVFEGTADNYPFQNEFKKEDFEGNGLEVNEGSMITVLGTSLQNKDVLQYFSNSSWDAVGLEMEGAHYQKAIQAESVVRKNISKDLIVRYAYYASDNPLVTGSTLASGSLGLVGVKPTYLITVKILDKILGVRETKK